MALRISLPFQLILVIIFVLLVGGALPLDVIRGAYTFSLVFKELLAFILPFIVFSFVLTGILALKKNVPLILSLLLLIIFSSNMLVSLVTYAVAQFLLPLLSNDMLSASRSAAQVIEPFFTFRLAPLIATEHALLAALVLGTGFSFFPNGHLRKFAHWSKRWIEWVLCIALIPLLPLYILGFLLKIRYEGLLIKLFEHYGVVFLFVVGVQIVYICWRYFLASGFSVPETVRSMRVALPSYITAFSTMSSTAAIPVTLKAADENIQNEPLAEVSIPIMANVHLMGDSISTPILALVTMQLYLGAPATFIQFIVFAFYFCLTMFAVAGIPGGGILVMIPILTSKLGFTPEMISVITTLYLLFDPFGTAANVMGDGALVIIVNKLLKKLRLI